MIDLYESIRDEDMDRAHHAYQQWGFEGLTREKMEILNQWARFIYEPLLDDRVRLIQEHGSPDYGRQVAEKVHAGLKRTGGVRPAAGVRADGPLGSWVWAACSCA